MSDRCYLVLATGELFRGRGFGASAPLVEELAPDGEPEQAVGEVVFNTGMCGYQEILTDPSYTGQIVTMTYPMIGNYGVDDAWNEGGPEPANRIPVKAAGFVVRALYSGSVPDGRLSLSDWLKTHGTPGITDVDTRGLTLRLRDQGSVNGVLVRPAHGEELDKTEMTKVLAYLGRFPDMEGRNLIGNVGTDVKVDQNTSGDITIAVVDSGSKANILRELGKRGVTVTVFPSGTGPDEILKTKPDAVLFSNGPGDPAVLDGMVRCVSGLIGKVPVCGICLGHQLICRALGADTRKMKFGHHGVNHPVRDERTGRVCVTSQNHGFDVDEASLDDQTEVWFRNANDSTIEGIRVESKRVLSVQFHPEAAPGPHDSSWIFDAFVEAAAAFRKEGS